MANVLVEESSLQDIADAIRTKNGTQNTYKPGQMADAIEAIPTGSTPTGTKQISITANGTTTEDVSAYANAEITVNVSGGGGGYLPLLDTIVIENDTRTYNLDLTPYSSYDMVLVVFDTVELSASDYLYLVRNGTSATGGAYTSQKSSFSGPAMAWGTWISPNKKISVLPGPTTLNLSDTALTNLFIYCYSATKTIKAGSTIKIYGG